MKYFFKLGFNADLSFAEIKATLENNYPDSYNLYRLNDDIAILDQVELDPEEMITLFETLGGSVKAGIIVPHQKKFLSEFINQDSITFGISLHPNPEIKTEFEEHKIKDLAKKIKEYYKSHNISTRYIIPKEKSLSTVRIAENQLLTKGFELSLLEDSDGNLVTGQTLVVQNYENFSQRDSDRPEIDFEMGILPPKLARIMVNLSETEPGDLIWDPFCGSGTILLEGLILSRDVLGSDISYQAVEDCEENIKWLSKNYNLENLEYRVFQTDIHKIKGKVREKLENTPIKAVVCEPYMGPPQKRVMSVKKAEKLSKNVIKQYRSLFDFLEEIGEHNLTIVIVVPSYKTKKGWLSISMNELLSNRWVCQNSKYSGYLHWKRKTSIIKRNIMIFKLKKY